MSKLIDRLWKACQAEGIDGVNMFGSIIIHPPFANDAHIPLLVGFMHKGELLEAFVTNAAACEQHSREEACAFCNKWNAENIAPRAFCFSEGNVVGNIIYFISDPDLVSDRFLSESVLKYSVDTFTEFVRRTIEELPPNPPLRGDE